MAYPRDLLPTRKGEEPIKGASAMGQTDIHRLSETVIRPVLKIILAGRG